MALREYTPRRRRMMQMIMCGILAATIALAAVVSRSANRAHRIELSPQTFSQDNVTVRLPLQWRTRERDDNDPRVIAQAFEPSRGGASPRVVRVLTDRIETPMSPLKYLCDTFGLLADSAEDIAALEDDIATVTSTAQIGRFSAILVGEHRIDVDESEERYEVRNDIYIATVLPTLQVIVVHQSGSDRIDVVDQAIARQVAASIEVSDTGATEPPQAVITLPAGIQLQPPKGFVAMQKSDTNRTDRLFWREPADEKTDSAERLEAGWASVEVVACLFPHRERDRAVAAIQTLLLARDQGWRGAKVSEQRGLWRADPPASGAEYEFPARAYLIPDRSDRALLMILRGGADGGGAFDQMWKELEASVRFLPASDIGQLESVGSTEAKRLLGSTDFTKLLGEREEQWWLYTGPGNRPHLGWSHLTWETNKVAAKLETRLRSFGGDVITRTVTGWSIEGGPGKYSAQTTRTQDRIYQPHTLTQLINVTGGRMTIGVRADTSDAMEFKPRTPPQYIPGGLLPMLIGQLEPGPLLIRTDSFIDCVAAGAPEPLNVIISPGLDVTRKAEGDDQPMRCVSAEVNGTGRVSRWYFRSSGELELIELSAGVVLTPSNRGAIDFAFSKTGPLAPSSSDN